MANELQRNGAIEEDGERRSVSTIDDLKAVRALALAGAERRNRNLRIANAMVIVMHDRAGALSHCYFHVVTA